MKKLLFLILVVYSSVYAQSKSIHQIEYEEYSKNKIQLLKSFSPDNFSFYSSKKNNLSKSVFGYLPDWEYLKNANQYINYSLITHLAVFPFTADGDGNIQDPSSWPWNVVINNVRNNNVKLILTLVNFTSSEIHNLFTSTTSKQTLFDNISSNITKYGFNGVNIDFENVKLEDRNTLIISFLTDLKIFLNKIDPTLELSFASPSINLGGWNFEGISLACDYLFVMGYDYYGSWSDITAPTSPLSGTNFNITRTLEDDYSNIVKATPNKLILGVPYYGNYWKTKTQDPYTKVDTTKTGKEWVSHLTYKEIIPSYNQKEMMWDAISKTPWIRWQDTKWNQIWYDNDSSLALKYNLAIQKNLKGIGIWALGYDSGRSELWNLINRKFNIDSYVEKNQLPTGYSLSQNYPNPFNPETIIDFSIPKDENVILKVYNLLGQEICTLINEFKLAGHYSVKFSAKDERLNSTTKLRFSSQIYFYTIISDNFIQTKKMILLQ